MTLGPTDIDKEAENSPLSQEKKCEARLPCPPKSCLGMQMGEHSHLLGDDPYYHMGCHIHTTNVCTLPPEIQARLLVSQQPASMINVSSAYGESVHSEPD
jgi:hypothetical protein